MLSGLFLRRRAPAATGPAPTPTLREQVAQCAAAEGPGARWLGASLYWTGAAVVIALAGALGGLTRTGGQETIAQIQEGVLYGLLAGLAVVAAILANRRRVYGRVRPPLGRRSGQDYALRRLGRAGLTPLRAGLLFAVLHALFVEGAGGTVGGIQTLQGALAWAVPLALLYWALESFLSPARIGGGHHVLLVFVLGTVVVRAPTSTGIVAAFLVASLVHVALSVYEDL